MKQTFYGFLIILLGAVAWLHLVNPIRLTTADLGRHIQNGEIILTEASIPKNNYYSYTHPEAPFICHHWGTGVIFYSLWKAWGFQGLSWVYGAILIAAIGFFAWKSKVNRSTSLILLLIVLSLPLLAYRPEVRPEGLTTLFLGVLFFTLTRFREGSCSGAWLWLIPVIQLVWVNVHLLFFIGFFVTGVFLLDALLVHGRGAQAKKIFLILISSVLVSLINPFGIDGLLQPLSIFNEYGYQIAENMNLLFMLQRFPNNPIYPYFILLLMSSLLLSSYRIWVSDNKRPQWLQLILLVSFGALAVNTVRAIPMFAFFFIPVTAANLHFLFEKAPRQFRTWLQHSITLVAAGFIFLAATVPAFYFSPLKKFTYLADRTQQENTLFHVLVNTSWWSGLARGVEASAEFFKEEGLKGPVFNNFDIGGYLIYHLFPGERPFVDNRPEAYPVEFFNDVYRPMQQDEGAWQDVSKAYAFETIYFYRHDRTSWAQPFLLRRIADPAWTPVFVDAYTIIMARRGGVNQPVIDKHEIPAEVFQAVEASR